MSIIPSTNSVSDIHVCAGTKSYSLVDASKELTSDYCICTHDKLYTTAKRGVAAVLIIIIITPRRACMSRARGYVISRVRLYIFIYIFEIKRPCRVNVIPTPTSLPPRL